MSEKESRMVGASFPDHLFQRLNLYALVTRQSRSQILRTALFNYFENAREVDPVKYCQDLANLYKDEYLRIKNCDPKPPTLDWYVKTLKVKLVQKGLANKYIDIIAKDILNEKNK